MKLSKNFSLGEFVKSQTALRKGIDNWPTDQDITDKLQVLCDNVLQPVRDHYGLSVNINSGYRCLELNRALGSKDTSQHVKGEAADIEIGTLDNYDLACWIRDNCDFDQILLEFYYTGHPHSGWVHVSYKNEDDNRKQCLTINKHGASIGFN